MDHWYDVVAVLVVAGLAVWVVVAIVAEVLG